MSHVLRPSPFETSAEGDRDPLSHLVIGLCIEVHKQLGPGLLESAYDECVAWELTNAGLEFVRQKPLPVIYKGVTLDLGYRLDIVIQDKLVIELKAIERILPIHQAQLLTYLKLSGIRTGLLINFCVPTLKDGIMRLVV
jgi:GxxExxY protein